MLDEIRAKRNEIYAIARKHKAESFGCPGRASAGKNAPIATWIFVGMSDSTQN